MGPRTNNPAAAIGEEKKREKGVEEAGFPHVMVAVSCTVPAPL